MPLIQKMAPYLLNHQENIQNDCYIFCMNIPIIYKAKRKKGRKKPGAEVGEIVPSFSPVKTTAQRYQSKHLAKKHATRVFDVFLDLQQRV